MIQSVVGVILVLPLLVSLPPLEAPPAPPHLVALTDRPAAPHHTLPVVGAVTLPTRVLTAQDDVAPSFHVLHQPHLPPHDVHVPDAADKALVCTEEIAGGVGEGMASQVDVVSDVEGLVPAPGPGGDGLLLVQLQYAVLVVPPEHQAVPLAELHRGPGDEDTRAGAQLVLDLQVTSHNGYGEPVRVAQPEQEDSLRVKRPECQLYVGPGDGVREGGHHDVGGSSKARLGVGDVSLLLAVPA